MGFILVIPLIGIYVILAILFVSLIWKHFRKPPYLWTAVAFVILLPIWDVVLGYIVYYAVCPFTKEVIYETAKTDGIYYEGWPRNELLSIDGQDLGASQEMHKIVFADDDFGRGYRYVESRIESKGELYNLTPLSPPQTYRCTPLPHDHERRQAAYQHCISVDTIQSGYAVKTKHYSFAINELSSMKIYNRATGQLMAEYMDIHRSNYFPFFYWLLGDWGLYGRGGGGGHTCPGPTRIFDFQYDVLKVKKNPSEA